MTTTTQLNPRPRSEPTTPSPRFGGVLWRITRRTTALALPFAGKRWNPVFAIIEHRGRRTGRPFATPVAARRTADGFVIALAFGAQVDWYLNLMAMGGGTIHSRGLAYAVGRPELIEPAIARAAFHPIQRLMLRIGRIDGYVSVPIVGSEPE
jgi:deazaflavin-dependent oxidoreductase (nitroreductase family)